MRTLRLAAVFLIAGIFCAFLSPSAYAVYDDRAVMKNDGRVPEMREEDIRTSSSSQEEDPEATYVPGDVIVVLRNTGSARSAGAYATYLSSAASSVGAQVAEVYTELSNAQNKIFARLKVSRGTEEHAVRQLKARSDVIGAQLNYKYKIASVTPNDTKYSSLWGMPAIKAPEAWSSETGSNNVFVAVIDSGVDYTHTDIETNFETNGYSGNYSDGTAAGDYSDANGHGTHVAGTIGAVGNNGKGVVGVNWTTKIISLRIFNASGSCSTSNILKAVGALQKLLDDNPAIKIASVNMSYGTGGIGYISTPPDEFLNDPEYLAYKALSDTNRIVLCVAAGNSGVEIGNGNYTYPASFTGLNNMIVVANAQNTSNYTKSSSSNYSTQFVDVAAPGTNILSTAPQQSTLNDNYPDRVEVENGYKYLTISGTSMATPHVAGAVALLASAYPEADAPALKDAIVKGANANYAKTYTVNGFLDVNKSLEILEESFGSTLPPEIITATFPKGYLGESYDASITVKGARPITWTKVSGNVPGLTFSNGRLYGIPTASGTYTLKIKAANANGSDTKSIKITISNGEPDIITETLPEGSVRTAYSATLSSKGTNPITWSLYSGTLPPSFKVNSNGTITGAYSKSGTWTFTVRAQNSAGYSTKKLTLTIKGVAPEFFTYQYLPVAVAGKPYSKQLDSTATAPAVWSVSSGTLPAGLSLNASTGLISGTPTKASSSRYYFTVKVQNDAGSANKTFYMYVDDPATSSDIVILPETSMPYIQTNVPYSYKLHATGTAPIKWTLVEGTLPSGITLSTDGTISGKISSGYGNDYVKVKASNSTGSVTKHVLIRYDYYYAKLVADTVPYAVKGQSYSQSLYLRSYTGDNVSMISGSLPPGMILSSGGYLSGTPTETGTYTFTVVGGATSWECHAKKTYTLTVKSSNVKPSITAKLPYGIAGVSYYGAIPYTGSAATSWTISTLPTGLYRDSYSYPNLIYGTPSQAGEYQITVTATNSAGTDTKNITIKILPANTAPTKPSIITTELTEATNGAAYSYQLEASGEGITWSKTGGSLPSGLSVASNGKISGTPKESGTFSFTVKATNIYGDDTQALKLVVKDGKPSVTTKSLPNATVGYAYTATLKQTGASSVTWTISKGSLPGWATLNKKTGKITGTPTKNDTGTTTFTVKATASNKKYSTKSLSITVVKAPSISGNLSAGTAGKAYSATLKVSGGTASYTWSISKGTLPTGLKLNASKGTLTGTPTTAGKFSFTVKVTDANKITATKAYTVMVNPVISGTLSAGSFNGSYTGTLTASKTTSSYTWKLSKGKLPTGLKLKGSGTKATISGTATEAGTYPFTLTVTDTNGATASRTFVIAVTKPAVYFTFKNGVLKAAYSDYVIVDGGTPGYTWTKSSGSLPAGLKLTYDKATGTATLSGTPTKAGSYTFTLKATDKNKVAVSKKFTVKITAPSISGTLGNGTVGTAYTKTLKASNGTSAYTWTISSGTLPNGLSLNKKTGKITGTPKTAKTYTFTVKVTDANKATATKSYTIKISKAATNTSTKTSTKTDTPTVQYEVKNETQNSQKNIAVETVTVYTPPVNVGSSINGVSEYSAAMLEVVSDDVLSQGEGRDEDLVSVRANRPVRFVIGTWPQKVSDERVYVDDERIDDIEISEGRFTLPAEFVHDDFKVQVKAGEFESQELYISAEQ